MQSVLKGLTAHPSQDVKVAKLWNVSDSSES